MRATKALKALVDNRWLNLMRWDDDGRLNAFVTARGKHAKHIHAVVP